ncbi:MAG: 50S ribosomal protein L9 [Acidobacteriota bacterium]|nr:50S ribosomal protein L9 [Acidobacteriota bacterium]MDH3529648.1 50S ribosomal protein L9 [Acidobacteriota bacterium]
MASTTTILLKEDIESLGGRGEIVTVRAGYARNYLLPRGYAILATKGNVKQVEQERGALLKKAAEERSTAEAQLSVMQSLRFSFERKAGESGTLFGSVTSMDIEDALKQKGYEVDRRKIVLKSPIKELGDYVVPVKLHRDVTLELPISVTAEGEVIQERLDEPEEESAEETKEKAPAQDESAASQSETEEE